MSRQTSVVILCIAIFVVVCDAAPAWHSEETADELSIVLGKANLLLDRLLALTERGGNTETAVKHQQDPDLSDVEVQLEERNRFEGPEPERQYDDKRQVFEISEQNVYTENGSSPSRISMRNEDDPEPEVYSAKRQSYYTSQDGKAEADSSTDKEKRKWVWFPRRQSYVWVANPNGPVARPERTEELDETLEGDKSKDAEAILEVLARHVRPERSGDDNDGDVPFASAAKTALSREAKNEDGDVPFLAKQYSDLGPHLPEIERTPENEVSLKDAIAWLQELRAQRKEAARD